MNNRSEYQANIQLVNTSTFSRGIKAKAKPKSEISNIVWFILIFGAIGYLLAVAYFAG